MSSSTWADPQVASSGPTFKRALIDQLSAVPALADVTVTWGRGTSEYGNERIMVGDVAARSKVKVFGGSRGPKRDEVMTVTVTISVRGQAVDGIQRCSERAYEIEGHIASSLRKESGDPSVNGTVLFAAVVASDLKEREQGEQFEALLVLKIETRNRI